MYFYRFFQTRVLVNILSRKSGIPVVHKRDHALLGWNFLHVIEKIIYEEFITLPGFRQRGAELHPNLITTLEYNVYSNTKNTKPSNRFWLREIISRIQFRITNTDKPERNG